MEVKVDLIARHCREKKSFIPAGEESTSFWFKNVETHKGEAIKSRLEVTKVFETNQEPKSLPEGRAQNPISAHRSKDSVDTRWQTILLFSVFPNAKPSRGSLSESRANPSMRAR
jgi:hypothetical protein